MMKKTLILTAAIALSIFVCGCSDTNRNGQVAQTDIENTQTVLSEYKYPHIALPQKLYASLGQTVQIYFNNICAYSTDDIYIKVTGEGNQYADRYEFTPSQPGIYEFSIRLYNKNRELFSENTYQLIVNDSVVGEPVKTLVLGDSLVEAGIKTGTMVNLSDSDGNFEIELLGSMGNGKNLYEGRIGWSTYTYTAFEGEENLFYGPESKTFDFAHYMSSQGYDDIDAVIVQLGANDVLRSFADYDSFDIALNDYITRLSQIIDNIKKYNPDVKIIVESIIPCDTDQSSFTGAFGTQLTTWEYMYHSYLYNLKLIEIFSNQEGNNVYLSWYHASLDAENNQGGDLHPIPTGYEQLGAQSYYFLKSIYQ